MILPFDWQSILLLALVLVLAQSIETILGFAGTIIALSLGLFIFPLEILLPTLVTIGLLQSTWLIIRWHSHIRWKMLLASILPLAIAGLAAGILVRGYVNANVLMVLLALFIIAISAIELSALFRQGPSAGPLNRFLGWLVVFTGGVFHGLFATGGPIIVYYCGREINDPAQFRSTLSFLWLILGAALMISLWINHQADVRSLQLAAATLPGFILGIVIGSLIHLEAKGFKIMTWSMLLVIGIIQLVKTVLPLVSALG